MIILYHGFSSFPDISAQEIVIPTNQASDLALPLSSGMFLVGLLSAERLLNTVLVFYRTYLEPL